ncbi:MAG: metallophosphoesterase family protein [Acidobacteria bacterium]|nr:metallophosphoesterase family protein [Acidobacteriota bacterium]
MRYLIVSDIHANWHALEAVLRQASGQYERILCCGDLVGYGADPNRVVDWARENVDVIVRGNHDKGCVGLDDLEWFNTAARQSAHWTQAVLTDANLAYLTQLPQGPVVVEDFRLVHGSPLDEDEYLIGDADVAGVAGYLDAPVYFFGHTHFQRAYRLSGGSLRRLEFEGPCALESGFAYLINPGSVSQPRDHDPRAAYAYYDSTARVVTPARAAYDIEKAQARILNAGLPPLLAHRLARGT